MERALLTRRERRLLPARWRRPRARAVPSPSAMLGWLERFHDPAAAKAVADSAFIPAVTAAVRGLWQVNQALVGFVQANAPSMMATLDMVSLRSDTAGYQEELLLYCGELVGGAGRVGHASGQILQAFLQHPQLLVPGRDIAVAELRVKHHAAVTA